MAVNRKSGDPRPPKKQLWEKKDPSGVLRGGRKEKQDSLLKEKGLTVTEIPQSHTE